MIVDLPTAWLKSTSIASGIESPTLRMNVGSTVPGAAETRSLERWNSSPGALAPGFHTTGPTVACREREIGPTWLAPGLPPTGGSWVPQLVKPVPDPKKGSALKAVP